MDDVVKRNRRFHRETVEDDGGESEQMKMLRELIDECERLRSLAEGREEVIEALKPFSDIADLVNHTPQRDGEIVFRLPNPAGGYFELERKHFTAARAALSHQERQG
jgi:hypothetical protein